MSNLLLFNLPYNVSDHEIRQWMESYGIGTNSIRIVRDVVSGLSPVFGHVELKGGIELEEAISMLDGKRMRNWTVLAREVPAYASKKRF